MHLWPGPVSRKVYGPDRDSFPARTAAGESVEDNAPAYADMGPNGGSLFNIRCLVSANLPAATSNGHTILMFDAGGIAYGQGTLTMRATTGGYIDMSDDPAGSSLVSLFQEDCVAVRVSRHFGYKTIRSNAVAVMTGVDW